jgi:hypothetical protein
MEVIFYVDMFTVVGSSKKIKVGLAMNATAALTLRLFPPLDIRKKTNSTI